MDTQARRADDSCKGEVEFFHLNPEGASVHKSITVNVALLSIIASPLVPTSHAQTATQPAASAAPVAANWKINCPGVRNVLMTADAEQSLPLQLIATLKCGEEVTFLDNAGGYTVQIQTADGKIGYVAAMYIKLISAPRRPPRVDSANIENGVARWQQGAPGCDHFLSNGILVESLTANGITVQVSLHDTGWKLRANVAIANSGPQPIHIQPSRFILDDVGVHGKPLFYQDPAQLAKNVTHQVLWTEAIAEPSSAPVNSTSSAESLSGTHVGYKSSFAPSASAPNYIIQHQYAEENAVRLQGKQTLNKTAQQTLALALKPATVEPNDMVAGAVWFERGKNPRHLMLRIPIENQTLEFPLSFKQQK